MSKRKHNHKTIVKFTKAEIQRIEDRYWERYNYKPNTITNG